uniref:Uncharacterized protein n=1 Tax=Rhizophora mucronata TaxID=61149 RepID=A0A2P2NZT9_RHIMU
MKDLTWITNILLQDNKSLH